MNISVVGTKSAGKGTQVSRLAKDFNLVAFATGDVFRAGVAGGTHLGKVAQKYVARGELVPDDIVNGLVEEWIWRTTPNQGIVFDGFPRTTYQAAFLENTLTEMGRRFDAIVYLDVSDESVAERIADRRVCQRCDEEFHLTSAPFRKCPRERCQGEHLRHLDEDRPEIVRTLVKMFQRGIEPLLKHYENEGRLIEINGGESVDAVHDAIVAALMPFR